MGLTNSSTGANLTAGERISISRSPDTPVIALAGNPNVGKSTIFNNLTGMNQHTGNWPGKTVSVAQGHCVIGGREHIIVDLPGTYSLLAHSAEEEVARNFICFEQPDAVVVVCDATCLERGLNLALQTMEISSRVILCVNLMDEAQRKGIRIDLELIGRRLGIPVVGVTGRRKKSLAALTDLIIAADSSRQPLQLRYSEELERAVAAIEPIVKALPEIGLPSRWLSLKLLENDETLNSEIFARCGDQLLTELVDAALVAAGTDRSRLKDRMAAAAVTAAEEVCRGAVSYSKGEYSAFDRRMDSLLTGRKLGYPLMLLLLALIFWLTIEGANYPTMLLTDLFAKGQNMLTALFLRLGAPDWIHGALVLGIYRVLTWVVAVMLPPMAIFFPLFTLLEDAGYLPRVAYNLDKPFKSCRACGKQALCMAMGFGCNAAGIVGSRIIDSPRERLLAILTNNFVPCNGRFPTLIVMLTIFFADGESSSLFSALLLTAVILFSVGMTFVFTKLLSVTLLKGAPSSFTLELPPYRRPQVGKVIVRSLFDRTLFVLGRAALVAAPAGLLIWLMANLDVGGVSLLAHCSAFLDPFARLMGLDGVILMAFILGFPANEIVIPIIIMTYTAGGSIRELESTAQLGMLLSANGWTWTTAVSMVIFSLMHWPCSTALITVYRETVSRKWTFLAALIPTAAGILLCMLFTAAVRLLS